MSAHETLRPCPFCGGAAETTPGRTVTGCSLCDVWTTTEKWNRRVSAPIPGREELRRMLAEFVNDICSQATERPMAFDMLTSTWREFCYQKAGLILSLVGEEGELRHDVTALTEEIKAGVWQLASSIGGLLEEILDRTSVGQKQWRCLCPGCNWTGTDVRNVGGVMCHTGFSSSSRCGPVVPLTEKEEKHG